MIASNGVSSDAGRFRLSVDSSHSVTTSTPTSSHQPRTSSTLSAPARQPRDFGAPDALAHRRLPSRMTPTWRGICSGSSEAAMRRA